MTHSKGDPLEMSKSETNSVRDKQDSTASNNCSLVGFKGLEVGTVCSQVSKWPNLLREKY